MELKSQDGFELVKSEELHKLKNLAQFIRESRIINSLAKTWRLVEKMEKILKDLGYDTSSVNPNHK